MKVNNLSHEHKTAIILLAAGNSSRLGRSKQLLKLADGNTLLGKAIDSAKTSSAASVCVVLGANYDEHKAAIANYEVDSVRNENWSNGMGSSIKCGIHKLLKSKTIPNAVIISVCDQVFLEDEVFNKLIQKYSYTDSAGIIASKYGNDNFGVPVLFDQHYFNDLLKLDDDKGALPILRDNLDAVTFVPFDMGNMDVDTEEDVDQFLNQKST